MSCRGGLAENIERTFLLTARLESWQAMTSRAASLSSSTITCSTARPQTQGRWHAASRENSISFSQSGSRTCRRGYRLRIEPKVIRVTASPRSFYGMQTLTQLLPLDLVPTIELPAVEITDARVSATGGPARCRRHFYSVEFLKKLLDVAAQYKINRFHCISRRSGWRIEIKRYPKLTQGKSLNPDDLPTSRITRRIRSGRSLPTRGRFITVIPEIEMPGHSGAARAAYPELAARRSRAPSLLPKAETFVFLENVLSESLNSSRARTFTSAATKSRRRLAAERRAQAS